MSKPAADLDGSEEAIGQYVRHLASMSYVSSVWVVGSRSPKSPKTARPDSDWDLMVERTEGHITNPRRYPYKLHVDLMAWNPDRPDAAQVWPQDEMGVLA